MKCTSAAVKGYWPVAVFWVAALLLLWWDAFCGDGWGERFWLLLLHPPQIKAVRRAAMLLLCESLIPCLSLSWDPDSPAGTAKR
jgi:hypothetical protein